MTSRNKKVKKFVAALGRSYTRLELTIYEAVTAVPRGKSILRAYDRADHIVWSRYMEKKLAKKFGGGAKETSSRSMDDNCERNSEKNSVDVSTGK